MASLLDGKILTYNLDKIKVQLESYKAYSEGYRYIVNQGGSRSGKTYGVIKLLIALALKEKLAFSVTSVAFPHLRRGAMRDWREIMENNHLYDQGAHVRTEQLYKYPSGSYMEFFSVDNNLKVRGPGRDILFINECNLVDEDTFRQLDLRTRKCIFIDYNPADEFHWLYDTVLKSPKTYFIKSTFRDNPFIPKDQLETILSYKELDENFWRIYGEGERGHSEGVIYTHWQPYSGTVNGETVYGLDFGYNNPTSLVRVTNSDGGLFWEEKIYQSHLTNPDLIDLLKQFVKPHEPILCDSAEPARIAEIKKAGFNAIPANKDVKEGILFVKSRKLNIHSQSANLLKEVKSYKYLSKSEALQEVPLKLNDHAMDAGRYGSLYFKKPKTSPIATFSR